MLHELRRAEYERARPLFEPLRYHLASAAVLDGNSPGRVFVDDPAQPRTAFMLSPEGCCLAGDPDNRAFGDSINHDIVSERALGDDVRVLFLVVHPERWRERLPGLLDPYPSLAMKRRHYVCRTLRYDWRAHLPAGCTVRRIDRELLESPRLHMPGHVTDWMENNWGSIDRFLQGGFGFVTVRAGEVALWSLSDCVSGDRCEIGIRTMPAHRRCGLATVTASAVVEYALSCGFTMVGWHCPADNIGSIRTAKKAGFRRERDYSAYYAYLDQHLAQGQ
jgi:RimJ/RimL family protein N-acetyltransferase